MVSNIGGRWDMVMRRGADFIVPSITFRNADGSPVNLTGCTFAASMRKTGLSATVALHFTIAAVDLANGIIRMSASAADTAALGCAEALYDPGSAYEWELRMVDAALIVSTPLYGRVNVMRQVQHA